jgi:hypothetical protein
MMAREAAKNAKKMGALSASPFAASREMRMKKMAREAAKNAKKKDGLFSSPFAPSRLV